MSVEYHPSSKPPAPPAGPTDTEALRTLIGETRLRMAAEITAMTRHLGASGRTPDADTVALLAKIDRGESPGIDEIIASHGALSAAIAPATPRTIAAYAAADRSGPLARIFGPTPEVRRIMLVNVFFVVAFFGLSLSEQINPATISLSIYDQQGVTLLMKLLFILSAAGIGATFGALFEIWEDIRAGTYDPATESAHWMRIALGIVAGLVLSEIVQTSAAVPQGGAAIASGGIAEPLLALVGGFSARVLHLVITRIVSAVESTFEPAAPRLPPPQSRPAPPVPPKTEV